jgi:ribosomal protein L37E
VKTNKWEANFKHDGKVFLVKCPQPSCARENYAFTVADGICAWCGYDANKDETYKKTLKEKK